MDDRELLELAAKAAGIRGTWNSFPGMEFRYGYDGAIFDDLREEYWNPLTDDADALRLVVKLNMHVQVDFDTQPAAVYVYGVWAGDPVEERATLQLDECTATRRAIVRAAAEIGRSRNG